MLSSVHACLGSAPPLRLVVDCHYASAAALDRDKLEAAADRLSPTRSSAKFVSARCWMDKRWFEKPNDFNVVQGYINIAYSFHKTVYIEHYDSSLVVAFVGEFVRTNIYSPAWLSVPRTKPRRPRYYRILSNYLRKWLAVVGTRT